MRSRWIAGVEALVVVLIAAPFAGCGAADAEVEDLGTDAANGSDEQAVLYWLNVARTRPQWVAGRLRELRSHYRGDLIEREPGRPLLRTQEGVAAVDEAIAAMDRQAPVPPLRRAPCLAAAARDHVDDQSRSGAIGHGGRDGSAPYDRMRRYCAPVLPAGENIHYGDGSAQEVVLALIVDDGVPNRGHRLGIFEPSFGVVGIGVGPHPRYRAMTVMDFAHAMPAAAAQGR